jgi:hypothetical protein
MSVQMGAWFALNVPWVWQSSWAHPMELLVDAGQVEACFAPFGDSVNLGARFAPNAPRA